MDARKAKRIGKHPDATPPYRGGAPAGPYRKAATMDMQQNRTSDFHVRMTAEEKANLEAAAENLGMTRSELIRLLAKLPAPTIEEGNVHLVAVDRGSVARIHREMRKFGTNFNQATHALNSINYYLGNGSLKYEYLDFAIPEIKQQLDRVEKRQEALQKSISALESAVFVSW